VIRVVHLSRNYHPVIGGTENFIASLARHVEPLGVESAVVCSTRRTAGEGPLPEVSVLRVPSIGPDRMQVVRHVSGQLRAVIASADILHFHDLRFGLDLLGRIKAMRGQPRVLSTHGLIFHTHHDERLKRIVWRRVLLPSLRTFDTVLADSAADFGWVSGLPRARLLENPVDIDRFTSVASAPPRPEGPLLYFGRVAPNKGLETLAPLLRRDESLRLVVTGRGDQRYLAALKRSFDGLAADFTGELDASMLDKQLRACSAIVLPSRTEGFGLTLVEAMATGRPVVAADIPPYREIAVGTGVVLVNFDNPAAVVEQLGRARRGADHAATVERALSYAWGTRAPEFADLYRGLVDAGHHARA
jgi:alpha-1,3-mannosyltransferase